MLRVPDKIQIAVELGGQRAQEMLVLVRFLAAKKSPFDFVFGPSDGEGKIEISRDQILLEARKTIDLFPIDYWNIEIDWTGVLRVTPMNRESIARALSGVRLYHSYDYSPGYEDSLRAADAILAGKRGTELTATVACDSNEPVTIETVRVAAA